MTERPNYAPGCFGSAHFFNRADQVCGSCVFADDCEVAHKRALNQFRQFYGIKTPTRKPSDLPVKVEKIFLQHERTKEEVRAAMIQGLNPYDAQASFLGAVCHMVLKAGTISRDMIERVLAKSRGLNAETASVYARHAIQILQYCDAITVQDKTVTLVRG